MSNPIKYLTVFCRASRIPAAIIFVMLTLSMVMPRAAPAAGTWTTTGSLVSGIWGAHTATMLTNGKVLVAGGRDDANNLNSAELYDPTTGTWTPTGSLNTARRTHTATLLRNGKVLVAGGVGEDWNSLTSAEIYDPATGTWTVTGALSTARFEHTATLLPNGKVLATAGIFDPYSNPPGLSSAEVYDPGKAHPGIPLLLLDD